MNLRISALGACFAYTLLAAALLGSGCRGHDHGEPEDGEAHDHHEEPEDPRPGVTVTLYQDGLELFMEHPAFVVGQPSPLVAHFTDARDPEAFQPITRGRVTAILRYADGTEARFVAEKPLRDGIFKPVVGPAKPGQGTLSLVLEGEQMQGRVDVAPVTVHPTVEAAVAAEPEEALSAEQSVPYLKEQQWKTIYATARAERRALRQSVRADGELKPVAGRAADLTAPVSGRVAEGETPPHLGRAVKAGELLVALVPSAAAGAGDRGSLELAASSARAELGLAQREHQRARELFVVQAIPEKQLDAARVAVEVAQARARTAASQLALYRGNQASTGRAGAAGFEVRAPFDGVIASFAAMPGAFVDAGTPLVSVVALDRLWLEARVHTPDLRLAAESTAAAFTVPGFDAEVRVEPPSGRRVAVGALVDPATRTVPVVFELPNPDGRFKPGMFAQVTLYTAATTEAVAIPIAAVVDDNGLPTVFAMEGGESFFRRRVRLGTRDGAWVQVLAGLAEGDRVVSRGAYEVKLSTTAGAIPAHGHQH